MPNNDDDDDVFARWQHYSGWRFEIFGEVEKVKLGYIMVRSKT